MGKIGWMIRLIISFVLSVIVSISVVFDQEQVTILDVLGIPLLVIVITPAALIGITVGQYVLMWHLASPGKDLWEPKK
ncbi:hypothetical protein [Nonomuraea dietziae]|uniref:hypothetical protein n=1 Tax=Nonomuraea dietziae TaxID=65515 RepID=UPI0033C6559A